MFLPENLLRRAAAMQGKERGPVPHCCVLDFDSELIPTARERFGAQACAAWSCFHTTLLCVKNGDIEMGIIAGTVGAPYATLVAEELIASGCHQIIAYASSGAIAEWIRPPCIVVPEGALRDEGTSYHYLPPAQWVYATGRLPGIVAQHAVGCGLPVYRGLTWTTDAPYRETHSQIWRHRAADVLCVEMEAAALMALAVVRQVEFSSLIHVTNALATSENDFHKGEADVNERIILCCLDSFTEFLRTEFLRTANEGELPARRPISRGKQGGGQ